MHVKGEVTHMCIDLICEGSIIHCVLCFRLYQYHHAAFKMFWKFNHASSPHIETLLNKEVSTWMFISSCLLLHNLYLPLRSCKWAFGTQCHGRVYFIVLDCPWLAEVFLYSGSWLGNKTVLQAGHCNRQECMLQLMRRIHLWINYLSVTRLFRCFLTAVEAGVFQNLNRFHSDTVSCNMAFSTVS